MPDNAARMTWRRRLAHFSGTLRRPRRIVFDNSRWGRHDGSKPLCQVVFEGRSSWVACGQPLPCPEHNDGDDHG
jgi:hypothetical protein